ncbi:MAG: hypothetical protein R3D44_18380 [Hyphomicrobiaceae bacterium]
MRKPTDLARSEQPIKDDAHCEALPSIHLASPEAPPGMSSRRDELNYLGDMAKELASMANRLDCPTLADLLDLAHREAELQSRIGRMGG